jgi:hypothetical protein
LTELDPHRRCLRGTERQEVGADGDMCSSLDCGRDGRERMAPLGRVQLCTRQSENCQQQCELVRSPEQARDACTCEAVPFNSSSDSLRIEPMLVDGDSPGCSHHASHGRSEEVRELIQRSQQPQTRITPLPCIANSAADDQISSNEASRCIEQRSGRSSGMLDTDAREADNTCPSRSLLQAMLIARHMTKPC